MNKIRTFCLTCLLACCASTSGQTHIAELRVELANATDATARFDALVPLASWLTHSHPDTTLMYAQEALAIAEQLDDADRLAIAYNCMGAGYWAAGALRMALSYFQQSKAAAAESGNQYLVARNIGNIGNIYNSAGNYKVAMSYYREVLPLFHQLGEQERIAVTLNNMGKALLELGYLDSALIYLDRSATLAETARPNILPIVVFNQADVYFHSGDDAEATLALELCLSLERAYDDLRSLIRANQLLAEMDLRKGNLDSALLRSQRAASLAETSSVEELRYLTYETLAHVLAAHGQYAEAYRYHELFAQHKDSLFNLETRNRLDFFDYEKQQQELELLRKEREYEQVQAQRRRIIIGALFGGLVLALLLGAALFQNQRATKRSNQLLRDKNHEIGRQKAAISEQAEQLSELNVVKDRLFTIISHDLRSPLRNLTELLRLAHEGSLDSAQLQAFLPSLTQQVDQTTGLLDNLLLWAESQMDGVKVHRRSFDLQAMVAGKMTFFQPLADQKRIHLSVEDAPSRPVFADQNMVDIVLQNLVANALKFSRPGDQVLLQTFQDDTTAGVLVRDTGIGIPDANMPLIFRKEGFSTLGTHQEKGTGLGLALCKDFIEKNGGRIWVKSNCQAGTTFGFSLPRP